MKTNKIKRHSAASVNGKSVRKPVVHAVAPRAKVKSAPPDAVARKRATKRTKAGVPVPPSDLWQLRLYVLDETLKSRTALANLKKLCETHLKGCYEITVIDLRKQPHLAKDDQILAIPTVVRRLPKPVRILIGTLTDTESVLVGLDLRNAGQPGRAP